MKSKIMYLIIGILIGAILTTTGFLIYNKTTKNSFDPNQMMQQGGEMGEKPDGFGGDANSVPPTKPDGNMNNMVKPSGESGDNNSEPPVKPDENSGAAQTESNS